MKVALVLNGDLEDIIIREDIIVCADGGYKKIRKRDVHAIVGDFDSLDKKPKGIKIIELPVEKDFTDGEKAIEYCKEIGAREISIYFYTGGRLDHQIGNLYLLLKANKLGMSAVAKSNKGDVYLLSDELLFNAKKGDDISIIPVYKNCTIKKSKGLHYKTDSLKLDVDKIGLGISNYAVDNIVQVEIEEGLAFVFHNKQD